MKQNMIDAREKFRPGGMEYVVQIKVEINMRFIVAVIQCLWQRKDMRITHTFTNDPFLNGDFDIES